MRLDDANLSIVGLGLIGGSLALALRQRCRRLVGVDSDPSARAWGTERAELDHTTDDLAEGLAGSDLSILAVPVGTIIGIVSRLGRDLPGPRFVLDVGSTKRLVVDAMDDLPDGIQAVGGHPFGGKETSGPSEADAELLRGRPFALVPAANASPEAVDLAQQVVTALGARPWITTADEHDRRVACTSQLPFVLAVSLVAVGGRRARADARLWKAAASGFLDTSRLAASNVTMMRDILVTNRQQTLQAVEEAMGWLRTFSERLSRQDMTWIESELAAQHQLRRSLSSPQASPVAADESHDLWPGA